MRSRFITLCLALFASVFILCQGCERLGKPKYGDWFCMANTCHLECEPGYAATGRTVTTQSADCSWTISPNTMSCSPAVALLIGGLFDTKGAEVYGHKIHYRLPNILNTRVGGTLDYVDSHIIACGGAMIKGKPIPPFPPARNSCIEMKDDLTWSFHSRMNTGRDLSASAVNLGKLTILGGTDKPTSRDTIEPRKSNKWKEETIKKTKYACAAKISPTEFMVTGGEYYPAEVLIYNVVTGEKTKLPNLTQERSGHGCAFVKHESMVGVMVAGGLPAGNIKWTKHVTNTTTNIAEFYSMDTGEWEQVGKLNEARRGLKMVFVDDNLYAMGGFNGRKYVATVEKFDFGTKSWEKDDDMLAARAFPGVVAVPKTLFKAKTKK